MEKKKIRIYLQYPWKFPDSPYYKYLIQNPPQNIEYLNIKKQKGVIINKRFFWISNFLKRNIRRFLNTLRLSIPNAHLSPQGDYDLIHCAHCLSKNIGKPWVADFESTWQLYIGEKTERAKKKVKEILLQENCKKIIAWTEKTKEEFIKDFPEIEKKIEVVYPAIPEKEFKRTKKKKIILIFSGRYFFWKGGLHAIEAIDRLTKKYPNVYGIINSEISEEIKNKFSKNLKISFYGLIPQEKLFELYKSSDIMIYPGYSDSFGFAYLEAISFGIPIVTVDGFARKEIIDDGKTGLIIPRKKEVNSNLLDEYYIKEILKKTSDLIEDKKLLEKMSNQCINIIKEGKFSIKKRNKKLLKIYTSVLK